MYFSLYNFPFNFKRLHRKNKLPVGFIFNKLALDYSIALTTVILRKEFLKDHPTIFNISLDWLDTLDISPTGQSVVGMPCYNCDIKGDVMGKRNFDAWGNILC